MSAPFSASSVERVSACPSSVVLDQAYRVTEDGERGTAIHLFAKRVIQGMSRAKAAQLVDDKWRSTCAGFDVSGELVDMRNPRAEVSYAFNPFTGEGRELGVDIDRKYIVGRDEIPGSVDVDGTSFMGIPRVDDWKTGYDVTPCAENLQMGTYACAKAAVTGANEIDARIRYVRENGSVRTDRHVFKRIELDDIADRLADTATAVEAARKASAEGRPVSVSTGPHCRYCPALTACPAHAAMVRRMLPELEEIDQKLQALTPNQKGAAYMKFSSMKALYERVDETFKTMARQQPVPLPGGKELREITFTVSSVPIERALTLLRKKGATEEEIRSLEVESPRSQVRVLKAGGRR